MTALVRVSLCTLALSAALMAAASAGAQNSDAPAAMTESPKWMQRFADDRAAILDARLAGLKAGLRLTPDQEKLWGPFEASVRDFATSRMARMQGMMERAERDDATSGPPLSPVDRLDRMATGLSDAGAALKNIADAAKPLYASLDDQQKRMFGFLSHEMMRMGRGHGMGLMGPMGRHHGMSDQDEGDDE